MSQTAVGYSDFNNLGFNSKKLPNNIVFQLVKPFLANSFKKLFVPNDPKKFNYFLHMSIQKTQNFTQISYTFKELEKNAHGLFN